MNQWTYIARIQEIPNEQLTTFQLNDQEIIVYRSEEDIYVYSNRCTHQSVPLSDGYIINETIICRLHGAKYDLRTGACLRAPACANLKPYRTAARNGVLFVACSDLDSKDRINQNRQNFKQE
ncbi:MAG: non-heme iron oxygenase ferredoxin subunit [Chloroflexota bacterium]